MASHNQAASGFLVRVQRHPEPQKRSVFLVANRTRNKAVTLRMTEEEFAFFQKQLENSKQKNQTDFFLAVLRKKKIVVVDDLTTTIIELKRQGNNLNQISRQLNEGTSFGEAAKKVMNECYLAYKKLVDLKLK
jgi:orotate phosphoribosyltransferase